MSTTATTDAGAQSDPHAVPRPALAPEHGYAIGDPGRAAREIGPGLPATPPGWPDTAIDAARVDGLELRAATVRGLSHRRTGTPRQDSYSVCWQPRPGRLVVTVCDGVGSLEFSHEAADLAAVRMPTLLDCPAGEPAPDWLAAFAAVSAEVGALATARGRAMATTVISACITANADTGFRAEIAWLGDSAAYLLRDGTWEVVGGSPKAVDDDGAPLVSSTAALPCVGPEPRRLTIDVGTGDALFLMTDGVADPLGGGHGEVGTTLAQWWSTPPEKFKFARQVAFCPPVFRRRPHGCRGVAAGARCRPLVGLDPGLLRPRPGEGADRARSSTVPGPVNPPSRRHRSGRRAGWRR